jgi:hypothetical protein
MRKIISQGFSVFHLCGFYAVSAFLGAFFLAAIEKDAIFATVKTKFAVFKPELPIKPQSCQEASKNRGVDDKDDDE